MSLTLKPVEPARGARWVRDAFSLFARKPLAFVTLFVVYMIAALLLSLLPLAGALLQMASLPLLSLGYMVAGQSALLGGAVHPGQIIEPLRGPPAKRRALITLCLVFGIGAMLILLLCDALSDQAMQRIQVAISRSGPPDEIDSILAEPGVAMAALIGVGLGSLLSVPFWHAPALVHWGGQGAWQALFSSTLAVWRCKGAFFVYGLCWVGTVLLCGVVNALAYALLGPGRAAMFVLMAMSLLVTTLFYVSLLFTFNDSFGGGGTTAADSSPVTES